MARLVSVMLVAALGLGACSEREIAPEDIEPLVAPENVVEVIDQRPLVAEVTALEITPSFGGVLLRATGRAAEAGVYSAELTLTDAPEGQLSFDLRAFQERGAGSGRVSVARFVSDEELLGVRSIRVRSASNALSGRP